MELGKKGMQDEEGRTEEPEGKAVGARGGG